MTFPPPCPTQSLRESDMTHTAYNAAHYYHYSPEVDGTLASVLRETYRTTQDVLIESSAPFGLPLVSMFLTHVLSVDDYALCELEAIYHASRNAEFTWDDPAESVWYGIPVNAVTDGMIWFMTVVLDMELTNGACGDSFWSDFELSILDGTDVEE